jgi:hypothetical protein
MIVFMAVGNPLFGFPWAGCVYNTSMAFHECAAPFRFQRTHLLITKANKTEAR